MLQIESEMQLSEIDRTIDKVVEKQLYRGSQRYYIFNR